MTHLLLLSLVFPPDNVSTAHLMGELVEDFVASGHRVTVLTTTPHFNRDRDAEQRQPMERKWFGIVRKSAYRGAVVYHVVMPTKTGSNVLRVLGWIWFHAVSLAVGVSKVRGVDVILSPSPPLTNGVEAWVLGRWFDAPSIYSVQELYPDFAITLGVIRNRWIIHLLLLLERFVYAQSAAVTVIAPRIRSRLLGKGVPPEKVALIPNWVDTQEFRPLPRTNEFSKAQDLDDTFVVSYAGNMGLAQEFDELIEAARLLEDRTDITFALIGDGVGRDALLRRLENEALPNLRVLSQQPYHLVPLIYASSDLNFVPLGGNLSSEALPSKIYRIMACGRAILALAPLESDLADLVTNAGAGVVAEPGSANRLAEAIVRAKAESAALAMGDMARQYVDEHYSRRTVVKEYARLIKLAAERKNESRKP